MSYPVIFCHVIAVSLTFQTNQSYAQFMTQLGAAIGHDPDRIQLQAYVRSHHGMEMS